MVLTNRLHYANTDALDGSHTRPKENVAVFNNGCTTSGCGLEAL